MLKWALIKASIVTSSAKDNETCSRNFILRTINYKKYKFKFIRKIKQK